ncbi:hypothetical protein [Natrinema sp. 1APR25-10V2]|uniref:hypothetical protein n=1 Tax=Natrinema sp. 1APR25-10V2 TaxID=2951081 RepID=UPI002876FA8D|nr:hypothetical protein [Natrinema sp. 1APR25-10V2]MDS0477077.1 hypothetical protein [Natrinema sp. 1APR25-10V2]
MTDIPHQNLAIIGHVDHGIPSDEIPERGNFAIRDIGQTVAAAKVLAVTEK